MHFLRFSSLVFLILTNTIPPLYGTSKSEENCKICGIQVAIPKIMNGTEVPPGKYPWIVSFKMKNTPNFCTGSIISSKFILSAAHCLESPEHSDDEECQTTKMPKDCYISERDLLIGLQDLKGAQYVEVRRIIPHPSYSAKTAVNDIALIQLKKRINCNLLPKPLCLPQRDLSKMGQDLVIAGYGLYKTNSKIKETGKLLEGAVKQAVLKDCGWKKDDKNMVCAKGEKSMQASCEGDSGSTLVIKTEKGYFALGVTSVGPGDCNPTEGDMYTNVYEFMEFIKEHVKSLPEPKMK